MRRYITRATQALRGLPQRKTHIMVRGMHNEGERDTSSENSQTNVIKTISNLSLTPHTKRGIRRVGVRKEHARGKMIHNNHKEKETGRPLIRRGK
jgi:hypothetical protein